MLRAAAEAASTLDVPDLLKVIPAITGTGALALFLWWVKAGTFVRGAELEKAQAERDALQKLVIEEVVPALTRMTDALQEATAEATVRRRQ